MIWKRFSRRYERIEAAVSAAAVLVASYEADVGGDAVEAGLYPRVNALRKALG